MMQKYNKKFSELRISILCNLAGVNFHRLISVKGFDGENGQFLTCKMFLLKQCRNKIYKMAHLLPTEMYKVYPEQLVNMLSTGVTAAVTKPEGGKGE